LSKLDSENWDARAAWYRLTLAKILPTSAEKHDERYSELNEQERSQFDKLLGEYADRVRRDLELSLSKPSRMYTLLTGIDVQDSVSPAVDTEGMDGEDPWSR